MKNKINCLQGKTNSGTTSSFEHSCKVNTIIHNLFTARVSTTCTKIYWLNTATTITSPPPPHPFLFTTHLHYRESQRLSTTVIGSFHADMCVTIHGNKKGKCFHSVQRCLVKKKSLSHYKRLFCNK